jgi:SAM-dependent methyltransferase
MHSEQFLLHADIEERHWWFVGRRRIMRRLVMQVLPPARDAIVVDVGCGTGANVASLADAYDCVGIDTSAEAISLARRRFPNVRFLAGTAPGDLGELAGQARLFLLMDVLEHVEDDFAMLSGLLAAASPGACFLITVPADEALWSEHDESFGHYRRYDRHRLERLWADLPVTPLLASYYNTRMYPLIRLIRARNRRRGHAAGRAGTDFWMPRRPVNRLLEAALAGEARSLLGQLTGRRSGGYSYGASLVALLRREPGPIAVRRKPDDLRPDHAIGGK